jgi:hypothetical protein
MPSSHTQILTRYAGSLLSWQGFLYLCLAGLFAFAYLDTFKELWYYWIEGYNWQFLVPIAFVYMLWDRNDLYAGLHKAPAILPGLIFLLFGCGLLIVGQLSSTHGLREISIIINIFGLFSALWRQLCQSSFLAADLLGVDVVGDFRAAGNFPVPVKIDLCHSSRGCTSNGRLCCLSRRNISAASAYYHRGCGFLQWSQSNDFFHRAGDTDRLYDPQSVVETACHHFIFHDAGSCHELDSGLSDSDLELRLAKEVIHGPYGIYELPFIFLAVFSLPCGSTGAADKGCSIKSGSGCQHPQAR